MADHDFYGTLAVSDPGVGPEDVLQKSQVDALIDAVEAALASGLDGKAGSTHGHSADEITDGATNKVFTEAQRAKLAGIAAGATVNATDEDLRDRGTHTGTQPVESIDGFDAAVNALVETIVDAEGATEALDTLREIASALGDDPNFSATITGMITQVGDRVTALEAATGTGAYKVNIGNGTDSLYTVTHGLNTVDVAATVRRAADGQIVYPVVKAPSDDPNTVTVDFGTFVPPSNAFRLLVAPQ